MSTEPLTADSIDRRRLAAGFFETRWHDLVDPRTEEVTTHLAAERRFVGGVLDASAYPLLVEAGCADGSLLLALALERGLAYLGVDLAASAVRLARRRVRNSPGYAEIVRGDIRDLVALAAHHRLPRTGTLVAFPFNVLGNIPRPLDALAAARAVGGDALVLTYDTTAAAKTARAAYYRAGGFPGRFRADATGVHFESGLFTSSAYAATVVTEWLRGLGYGVTTTRYGHIGIAYHGRLVSPA